MLLLVKLQAFKTSYIQFTREKSQTKLLFIDRMTNDSSTKICMGIYNKPTDSKLYVPFTPNHSWCCLENISFSLVRRISTIAEDENKKEQRFKEPKKTLLN